VKLARVGRPFPGGHDQVVKVLDFGLAKVWEGAPEPQLAGVARHFELAAAAQRACPDIPVVGTGYSYLRQFALEAGEANLRDGRAAIVGMGRGAIAYPDFARDVHMDKRKVCITVSYCTTLMRAKGNELGQYAAGCAPRDPVYGRLLQEIQRKEKQAAATKR